MSEPSAAVGAGSDERPPLDDIMLSMDVVDTLRRRELLVARELDEAGREADLKQRLKGIYAQQGIDVPDHVIEQGVAALKEDRFTYQPTPSGLARRLAMIYVSRGRWGKWVSGGLAAALLVWVGNYYAFVAPDKTLPDDLRGRYQEVVAIAASDQARSRAEQLLNAGNAALRNQDTQAARDAVTQLERLQAVLQQEYSIQILNRPDTRTGVWRIPDVNPDAKNYYIIVEAVGASGERLQVPIRSEETGEVEQVSRWGLRVERPTFEAVARDKQDDGIIQNDRFGRKRAGFLDPEYAMPTSGGAITRW